MKKIALVFSRVSPLTVAHQVLIKHALTIAENVFVCIGASDEPRTAKNPWTFKERVTMIRLTFHESNPRIFCIPIHSYIYDMDYMLLDIYKAVENKSRIELGITPDSDDIVVVGCEKDKESTDFLKSLPWKKELIESVGNINATDVRKEYFEKQIFFDESVLVRTSVPNSVYSYLKYWAVDEPAFATIRDEHNFYTNYRKTWNVTRFTTFLTGDAIITQGCKVLLIQRKDNPGKDLWAIPGGFVEPDEAVEDAIYREAKEETLINIEPNMLRALTKTKRIYDYSKRSLRARIVTLAGHIDIPTDLTVEFTASDDAKDAKWFDISDLPNMRNQLFEDHFSILFNMLLG